MECNLYDSISASNMPPRNAWGKKELGPAQTGMTGSGKWHQQSHSIPEWANEDTMATGVGTFDSSGNFTSSGEKVNTTIPTLPLILYLFTFLYIVYIIICLR